MLALLVPGVGMGGSDEGAAATPNHLLMLMGVGRMFIPFMLLIQGVFHGR